ncbi:hypothetical protein LUZ63_000733 [Rhynchospora breviuscula]|uniref:Reverse transcriptase domain-containing protein n=1 Tax=Rhynchospora breviuscula TaxID=2022672 RepID=A0A9Q0CWW0_9POAL|nr:hypothetical protein LUZ63_000733 [Rhynchospora breviuscula]
MTQVSSINNEPSYFPNPPFKTSYSNDARERQDWQLMNFPNFKDNIQNNSYARPFYPKKSALPPPNQPNNNPMTFHNATFDNNRSQNFQPRNPFLSHVPLIVQNFMYETPMWNQSVAKKLDKFEDGLKSITRLEKMMEAHFSLPGPSQRAPWQLPSQPELNPMGEVKAISLRSGTPKIMEIDHVRPAPVSVHPAQGQKRAEKQKLAEPDPRYIPPVPFPQRLGQTKTDKGSKSFLHMLKQLHITIPFADAITQIPTYAKFLKDIISNKRPLEE